MINHGLSTPSLIMMTREFEIPSPSSCLVLPYGILTHRLSPVPLLDRTAMNVPFVEVSKCKAFGEIAIANELFPTA